MKLEGHVYIDIQKEKTSFILPSDKKANILVVQSLADPELLEALTVSIEWLVTAKAKNNKEN